jgi:hypothetical protein
MSNVAKGIGELEKPLSRGKGEEEEEEVVVPLSFLKNLKVLSSIAIVKRKSQRQGSRGAVTEAWAYKSEGRRWDMKSWGHSLKSWAQVWRLGRLLGKSRMWF